MKIDMLNLEEQEKSDCGRMDAVYEMLVYPKVKIVLSNEKRTLTPEEDDYITRHKKKLEYLLFRQRASQDYCELYPHAPHFMFNSCDEYFTPEFDTLHPQEKKKKSWIDRLMFWKD